MPKSGYEWTKAKYNRFLKEKRGLGSGKEYKPWLTIRDVPSEGRSTILKGWKTERSHHLLSLPERNYLYLLDWADNVVDIREQYPLLDVEDAIAIADEAKIQYPKSTIDETPWVLTTDFFVTVMIDGQMVDMARTIKKYQELDDLRVLEKLEIERRYWQKRGIDWGVVTEDELPTNLITNLGLLRTSYGYEFEAYDKSELDIIYSAIKNRIMTLKDDLTIRVFCSQIDDDLVLDKGTTMKIITCMIVKKVLTINMQEKFSASLKMSCLKVVGI